MSRKVLIFILSLCFIFSGITAVIAEEQGDIITLLAADFDNLGIRVSKLASGSYSAQPENLMYSLSMPKGEFAELPVKIEKSGLYQISTTVKAGSGRGIYEFSINNTKLGNEVNAASTATANHGLYFVEKPGIYRLRWTSKNTKNGTAFPIRKVTIERQAVKITSESTTTGNIFYDDERIVLPITLENGSAEKIDYTISYKSVSDQNEVVDYGTEKVTLNPLEKFPKNIEVKDAKFGVHTLKVRAEGSDGSVYEKGIQFARMIKAEKTSSADDKYTEKLGFSVHFGQGGGNLLEPNSTLLDNIGTGWIRDEYGWGKVELEKGVYTFPENLDAFIDRANESGRKILIVLDYGNPLYENGGVPITAEGRKAFVNYAKAVAEHLKGKVDAYEIWNEWDGGFGIPNSVRNLIGGEASRNSGNLYAELLKEVYPALKEIDENVTVVVGAASAIRPEWLRGIFENDGLKYCDAFSYHPYGYPGGPEDGRVLGSIENHTRQVKNIMAEYGEIKPLWFTEWGWPAATKYQYGVTDIQQRDHIVRALIQTMSYGDELGPIFIYDFEKDGKSRSMTDREAEFGIINNKNNPDLPFGASPAYVTLGFYNNLFSGTEYIAEYNPTKWTHAYVYRDKVNNKEVVALWTVKGSLQAKSYGETAGMKCYDIYGNEIVLSSITNSPIYLVGECGQFDIKKIDFEGVSGIISSKDRGSMVSAVGEIVKDVYNEVSYALVSETQPITYDVEDSFIYKGTQPLKIDIEYLGKAPGNYWVEYKDIYGNIQKSSEIPFTNSEEFVKSEIIIENACFDNTLDNGDFMLRSTADMLLNGITVQKCVIPDKTEASISFDTDGVSDGIIAWGSNDLFDKFANYNGRRGWESSRASSALYLICDIDDTVVFGGDNKITLSIDYFDKGKGKFAVAYETTLVNDRFYPTAPVQLEDTGEWKTAVFEIEHAALRNSTNLGDFRIALWSPNMGSSEEDICFGSVKVKVHKEATEKNKEDVIFNDISGHWSEKEVYSFTESTNAISGYEDGSFKPEDDISVEEFIKILVEGMNYRIEGAGENWSTGYINKAKEVGIIKDGEFTDYSALIKRGEIARILERVHRGNIGDDVDVFIETAEGDGIMTGYSDGQLHPEYNATRAEAIVMLSRLIKKL